MRYLMLSILLVVAASAFVGCDPLISSDDSHNTPSCTSAKGHVFGPWKGQHMSDFGYIVQQRTCSNCCVVQIGYHK